MIRLFGCRWTVQLLALAMSYWVAVPLLGASAPLVWDKQHKQVDAQIEGWDLPTLLGQLSKATGWQVFIEPGTEQTVSVRFKNLAVGEALKRMLGELNFALLPQTNAPPRLFVFRNSLQEATQLVREAA